MGVAATSVGPVKESKEKKKERLTLHSPPRSSGSSIYRMDYFSFSHRFICNGVAADGSGECRCRDSVAWLQL
jgi:hypothetical protein